MKKLTLFQKENLLFVIVFSSLYGKIKKENLRPDIVILLSKLESGMQYIINKEIGCNR